ncbi:AAA family ATPase [Lentzea sp. NPDC004789]
MVRSEAGEQLSAGRPGGRARALAQAAAGVHDAARGRMGLLHLRGPRGIGKSAVVGRLREEVREAADVLVTTCRGGEDFATAEDLLGAVVPEAGDEYARRHALNDLVARRTADRPVVLVLEDAHRCDSATARWLSALARRVPEPRVYVVLVHRCSERVAAETLFADLTGALDTTTVDLGPLDESDVTELLRRECGSEPAPELVRAALESTAGLPAVTLAWAEKFRALGAPPDVAAESAAWHLAWLEDQPESTRAYATAVAVLGSTEPASTAALAGISAATAASVCAELTALGALTPQGRFRSAVLRERLLAAVDQDALRVRAARLLSDEGRPQEEVAELVAQLPELTEVWMFCALRGAAREGTLSPEVAISHLRRVLNAVPGHVETRLELAAKLRVVDPSAAMDVYAELLSDVTEPAVRASVAVHCGASALRAGREPEAFGLLAGYLAEGEPAADPELRAQIEAVALVNGFGAARTVRRALDLARTITPPEGRAEGGRRLVQQLARAEVLRGESLPTALAHVRSALPAPGGARDFWDVFTVTSLHFCGERTEAMTLADEIIAAGQARGDTQTRKIALAVRAALAFEAGELPAAERDARAALAIAGADGDFAASTVLASALVRRGEVDQTEQILNRLGAPRDPVEHGWAMDAKALWLWNRGEGDAAIEVLLRCGREFESMGVHNPVLIPWWLHVVTVLVRMDRYTEAAEVAERGAEAARRWNTPVARGYALYATGLTTDDVETLEQAVVEFGVAGAQLDESRALAALGRVLIRTGHDKAARKHLRASIDIAVRCGASRFAIRPHALLTSAGGRMSAIHASPKDALTVAERRVASLAADGLTNREIAEKLYVTIHTVESHLSNAYRKLGAQTRAELAAELR